MQLSVYVVGHGEIVQQYFNAIAATMGSSTYATAIRMAIILGGLSVLFQYITRRSILEIMRWLLLYYVVYYIIFLPKVTVAIEDQITQKPLIVDNVPFGVAVIAHYSTALGRALTTMTETTFTLPNDLRYGHSGMVMASRMVSAASTFQIPHPVFNENVQAFVQQCVFYDLLLNKYALGTLEQQSDLWAFMMANASPARMFPYKPLAGGGATLQTCKEGAVLMQKDWETVLPEARRLYGARLFPSPSSKERDREFAAKQLEKFLPGSYNHLLKASRSASEILQQSMMANAVSNTAMRFSSTADAPAALQAFVTAKTHMQERMTYQSIGERAAHWLPLLKNSLEAILYGSFIITFLLMLFPFGATVLRHYAFALIWLQSWPPLYAIVNLIVSYYAERSSSTLAGGTGLTLHNLDGIFSINADMASLAGYLSLSVPALAYGLVKGMGGAMSSMAQYVGGVTQSVGSQIAAEASSGNISMGNTSVDTHSAFNMSANHADTMGRFNSGGMSMQMPGGSMLTTTANGTSILDTRNALSHLGTGIQLSESIRTSALQQADSAYQAALSSGKSYQESLSEGMRSLNELAQHQGKSQASGESVALSNSSNFNQAVNKAHRLTDEFAKRHNLSYGEASNVLFQTAVNGRGNVGGSASVGGIPYASPYSGSASLSFGASATRSSTDTANTNLDKAYANAETFIRDTGYSETVDSARRATQESNFRMSNEEGQRLANSMASSLDKAQQARQDMTSNLQKSESYRKTASFAQDNAVSINSDASQAFYEWVQNQPGTDGKGRLGANGVETMQQQDPIGFANYAKQFAEQYSTNMTQRWQGQQPASAAAVQAAHERHNQSIPSKSVIESGHQIGQQQINESANAHGLGSGTIVDPSVKRRANEPIQSANNQIAHQKQGMNQASDSFAKTVKGEINKTPKKHTLIDSTEGHVR